MRRILVILPLVAFLYSHLQAQCDGNAHSGTYYVDNSCGTNGNGSTTSCGINGPFNSIANAQARSGGYAAGSYICLQRGQTYREAFSLPSSGSSSSHIVLTAYGSGNKPIIKASNIFSSWTLTSGTTFKAAAPASVSFVWKDGEFQKQGSSVSALNNHEWFWSGGTLYFREDENDLGSHIIEGSVRPNGIYSNSASYWDISSVRIMHSDSSPDGYGFRFQGGTGFNVSDCDVVESRALLASSTSSIVVNKCNFKYSHGDSFYPQAGIEGSTSITFYNTIFRGSTDGQPALELSGTATANIYNSLFDEYGGSAVISSSSGTCNIQNSIFTGGVSGWGGETIARSGTGAINVDYSLLLPYGRDGQLFLKGVTEGTHNLYVAPNFRGSVAKGYLIIGSDDTGWYKYFDESSQTADQYGYKVGFAVDSKGMLDEPESVTYIQSAINRGHWISSHSHSHAELATLTGMTIQYTGTGTAATLSIASNHLVTQVTGAADSLNLDLTNSLYGTLYDLCQYLTTKKYSCTGTDDTNYNTAAVGLADVSTINIKSAPYSLLLNQSRYLDYEINGSQAIISATLKNPDGTPYSLDTFVYPYGQPIPEAAATRLKSLHFLGARSTFSWLAYSTWRTSAGIDLYGMLTTTGVNTLGELAYLFYVNNCNDLSEGGRNFTCRNITYSSAVTPPTSSWGAYSAVFNGTTSYAQRSDSSIDFHRGDGYWSAYVRPNVLNKKQTLFYQGSDISNYHTLYLSSSGTIVYSVVASGSETVHVETGAGLLSTSAFQRITLTFNQNTYKIFVGAPESTSLYSTNRPGAYTGAFIIGAGGIGTLQDYFSGYINGLSFGTNTFAAATAFLDTLSSQGGIIFLYGHGDPGLPVGMLRVLFQAKKASSANVMLDTYHNVLADLRSHGILGADGRTLTWVQADGSDYHLLPNSALVNMGWSVGAPTTDFDGNPRSGQVDIGIYEYINTLRRSRSSWW